MKEFLESRAVVLGSLFVTFADLVKFGTVILGFLAGCLAVAAGWYQFKSWKTRAEMDKIELNNKKVLDK